ncbi:MAG TPA: condensation domain-containing protein [Pseudonocardiaceae bacterium]|jgi:hypothetical protein|nr:condensation domain-containing protein [Pseudonocardiaceae bacterium]
MGTSTSRELWIDFDGGDSGAAGATWGQHAIWDVVRTLGAEAPRYNVSVSSPVAPTMPVSQILDAIRPLIGMHESLRTRLLPDGGGLRQVVDAAGRVPVVVRECAADDDLTAVGAALYAELAGQPFDFAGEWPIRVGLVTLDGLVRTIALSLSHTAVDAWGLRRLALNMAAIALGEPVDRLRERLPSMQPRSEAEFQTSDRGRRLDAGARQHWIRKLRLGPEHIFSTRCDPADLPWPHAVLNSPALAIAADSVATGHQVSTSSVVLAAASVMVSRLSGSPDAAFQIVVNNRFLPGLTNAVSTLAQEGLFHFPNVDKDFAEAIRRTHRITLNTYRNSYYDKRLLDADIERAGEDGGVVGDHSCFFNDVRNLLIVGPDDDTEPEPLAKALARTTFRWSHDCEPRPDVTFAVDLIDAPGSIELVMVGDGGLIPRPDMERFLYGIEDLVVGEAIALGR